MKRLFKIITSAICIGSIFSIKAYATETKDTFLQVSNEKLNKLEVSEQQVKDLHESKGLNMRSLQENLSGKVLNSKQKLGIVKEKGFRESANSVSTSISGTIEKEGDLRYTTVTLEKNQIVQTTLKCPTNENLNYDLYLYELNDDGSLGNYIDSSTTETYFNEYPDGTRKTLDEGISYINKNDATKHYAIIVLAKKGCSAIDKFTINVSLDIAGSYDQAEPNDSPYHAYTIKEGTLSGANLNSCNDQDWFVWNVPEDFKTADISVSNGYKVELYTANGTSMVLRNNNGGNSYYVSKGYYYIKVFSDSSDFKYGNYTLKINPTNFNASKLIVDMEGDLGKDFPDYPGGVYLRFKKALCPTVYVASANNYPVSNWPVTLNWISESWTEQSGNHDRSQTLRTGSDGSVKFNLAIPVAIGSHTYTISGAKTFIHYFDIDGVIISAPGISAYTSPVYHLAYSDYIGG